MSDTRIGLRPVDTRNGHCDECGDAGLMAVLAEKLLCGDCCQTGVTAAGVESESEVDNLKAEVESLEEDIKGLRDDLKAAEAREDDAVKALRAQEEVAAGLAKQLDQIKRVTEGLPLLPEPKPRKPRAKKAEATP